MRLFHVTTRQCYGKLVCARNERAARKMFAGHRGVRLKTGELPKFYAIAEHGADGPFVLADDPLDAAVKLFGVHNVTANSKKLVVLECTRLVFCDLGFRLWYRNEFRALYSFDQLEQLLMDCRCSCRDRNDRLANTNLNQKAAVTQ